MAKTIEDYKKDYAAARARGDAAGMQAANDGANAIRRAQGQAEEHATVDIAKFQGSSSSGSTSKASSGGTGKKAGVTIPSSSTGGYNPLSPVGQEATGGYATGSTTGAGKYVTPTVTPGYTQAQMDQAIQDALAAQKQQSQYDLSEQLRRQKAAETEAALAALKGAYESSLAGYGRAVDTLGDQYSSAKNQAAAQAALARKAFAEQAQASGLNYGVTGQAELARSSMLQQTLAGLDSDQAGRIADLDVEKAKLQADYEAAIAQAKADGDASLATALYQELVRVQELQREDELRQEAYAREQEQLQREEIARADAAAQAAAEERAKTMAAIGDFSGYRALGYSDDDINRLEAFYRQNMAAPMTTGSGSTSTRAPKTSSGTGGGTEYRWSDVEDWVGRFGEEAAEDYIRANYAAIGPNNMSTTLAAWRNYRLEHPATTAPTPTAPQSTAGGEYGLGDLNVGSIQALGLSGISYDTVEQMVEDGILVAYIDVNGKVSVRWAPGYNGSTFNPSSTFRPSNSGLTDTLTGIMTRPLTGLGSGVR